MLTPLLGQSLIAVNWQADFTHKYKIIKGITTKLNPIPQGGGPKSYFPFQRVLGSVRG